MSIIDDIRAQLNRLQEYASAYFEVIYKTVFDFWTLPNVPLGGNVLTGAFAIVLITMARAQMSQPTNTQVVASILVFTFFFMLLICGLLVVFDRQLSVDPAGIEARPRIANWQRLVSVVSIGITLGCAFIVLDKIFPWVNLVFGFSDWMELSSESANRSVVTVAAFSACIVILFNTVYRTNALSFLSSPRSVAWMVVIFCIIIVGLNILVADAT